MTIFCVYWISQFEGLSTQCSQATVKAMFTRLRKLQCLKQCIIVVLLVLAGMAVNGLIKYLNIKYLCVFKLPKKVENWYEPPGLRQEDDKKL